MPELTTITQRAGTASRAKTTKRLHSIGPEHRLLCPGCKEILVSAPYDTLAAEQGGISCVTCSHTMGQTQGIWLALRPERKEYFADFMREYETVREREGRGSHDAEFYLSLPHCDTTGRNAWQWAIRSRSYNHIRGSILPKLTADSKNPLSILDMGAGNGWLSYRLAAMNHRPIAVDLLTNQTDGLAAASHYQPVLPRFFPRFQAEMDCLPFADDQFDCCIFNASFHYSENYDRTIAEAIRCLRPGGMIIIADTPWYSSEECGQRMVHERQNDFLKRFGFASDRLASGEYLTDERLAALEVKHEVEWQTHRPWYGIRWALRPSLARWKGKRESSEFRIYSAQVKAR